MQSRQYRRLTMVKSSRFQLFCRVGYDLPMPMYTVASVSRKTVCQLHWFYNLTALRRVRDEQRCVSGPWPAPARFWLPHAG